MSVQYTYWEWIESIEDVQDCSLALRTTPIDEHPHVFPGCGDPFVVTGPSGCAGPPTASLAMPAFVQAVRLSPYQDQSRKNRLNSVQATLAFFRTDADREKRPQAPRPDEAVNEHGHRVPLPPPRLSRSFGTLMLVSRHGGALVG